MSVKQGITFVLSMALALKLVKKRNLYLATPATAVAVAVEVPMVEVQAVEIQPVAAIRHAIRRWQVLALHVPRLPLRLR